MSEIIHFQIDKNHVTINGLHPKHPKTQLKLSVKQFNLIRDVLNDDRYKQAFTLLCQEIVEALADFSPSGIYTGSIEMDKLWDDQHVREKYDRSKEGRDEQ